jgi:hypothetical protein
MDDSGEARWRLDGVRVVHSNQLDINTPQTEGMSRAAAITHARAGRVEALGGHGRHPPQGEKLARTITGRSRASFMWSAGEPA